MAACGPAKARLPPYVGHRGCRRMAAQGLTKAHLLSKQDVEGLVVAWPPLAWLRAPEECIL